jgi:23S rRNA pseudouridine1911/1915/1917 synthase
VTSKFLPVPDACVGERVDAALARMLGLSRTAAADLAIAGCVFADGRKVDKSDRLREGQIIEVELDDPQSPTRQEPQEVEGLHIVHLDDDLVVIDKPVGVAAHSSPGWTGPTVTAGLAAAGVSLAQVGAAEREGIVHRLDAGTSGLMVVARSERAYRELKDQFRERTVAKTYHALVQGHPDPARGTIDAPIGRHPHAEHKFAVVAEGKPSITHYDTIEAFPHASLMEIHLETGRTHQIRVHFAALRHPCCGDTMYGADPTLAATLGLRRQWLHAIGLEFTHPATGERVRFESDYPQDLQQALDTVAAGVR